MILKLTNIKRWELVRDIWPNSGVKGRVMVGNTDKIYTKVGPYNKPFD